ncbi:adenosylcobinamide-phosphate synthase CbiB [Silvibacterium dinghuense]|uniref:adenosylcobinamide-phosphate synthase CbiB n=1 Tax=Silvibacterium dinghuense TaxID=1560006 RepID=UPI001E5ED479|nr:adenosylcobinamide-phosphate synthase CbiB [Silvibacterium dinghuense]
MRPQLLLPAVYLADQAAGDPEWFPHPVRLMGSAVVRGESLLRRPGQSREEQLLAGAMLTATVVGSSYLLTRLMLACASRCSPHLGRLAEIGFGWTCLAARNLQQEASQVLAALNGDDLPLARTRLARIVGRDTESLDAQEISRAVIETVAESASDGVMAPLFYMALGGVPLAMAYKAVNTLDSMIGHADERYLYFGKAAARLDDAANFIPARMTALAVVAASWLMKADAAGAWRLWLRDGNCHKSPNAGQPESAIAGALGVRLGGGNCYAGEFISAEPIGAGFRAPELHDAQKAVRVVSAVGLLGLGAAVLLGCVLHSRRKR